MFRWLLSWFKNPDDDLQVFRPKVRMIYQYFDGREMRKADPMRLYKLVMVQGPELNANLKGARSPLLPPEKSSKCHDDAMKTIRSIFDLKTVEEGGLEDMVAADLLDHFMLYCDGVKKNSSSQPTITNPPLKESEPTTNISDSGLTVAEVSTDKPQSSPMESPSPMEQFNQELNTTKP